MSKTLIPFFELNGRKYEIRRTHSLMADFDDMKQSIEMTDEEMVAYTKEMDAQDRLDRLTERKNELYDKYLDTFDDTDKELYDKACAAHAELLNEIANSTNVTGNQRQRFVDVGEKLIISAIQYNEDGKKILSYEEAKTIWESFVLEYGKVKSVEFIIYTTNYLIGGDDDIDNPFISQAQAKAEQKANLRRGIRKAR